MSSLQIASWNLVPDQAKGTSNDVRDPLKYSPSCEAASSRTAASAGLTLCSDEGLCPIVTAVIVWLLAVIVNGPSGDSMVNDEFM